jgi:SAM-dependent methyltransferase
VNGNHPQQSAGALGRWARELQGWGIPKALLDAAPVSPWGHDVRAFERRTRQALAPSAATPSRRRALEALPEGGTVLDVGCGAGAASLALAGRAGRVTGVDRSAGMLTAFTAGAESLGLPARTVEGRWPEVADRTGQADVVVCHHVLYDVADLGAFAAALSAHARRRVVVELTAEHPLAWLRPYWRRLHDLDRPIGPRAEDAAAALAELGLAASSERFDEIPSWPAGDDLLGLLRRRLCLPPERDPELRAAVEEFGVPASRPHVTLYWP